MRGRGERDGGREGETRRDIAGERGAERWKKGDEEREREMREIYIYIYMYIYIYIYIYMMGGKEGGRGRREMKSGKEGER